MTLNGFDTQSKEFRAEKIAQLDSKSLVDVFLSYDRKITRDRSDREAFWNAADTHGLLYAEILKRCGSSRRV